MRRTKRLGAFLIALVMIFTMLPVMTAGAVNLSGNIVLVMNSTDFTVNGTKTKIDAQGSKPVQSKGYTMLPLRAILEATGGTLSYDGNTKKITIQRGGDTVVLTLDSKTAVVNGGSRSLGAAPYATNGRTMVHIRTLELFGMKVDWDSKTNNVTVKYVEPTKIFNLTLQNGMGTPYSSVEIAPMGTGTPDWSGNLLGADTLNINGNLTVQAPITGTGMYQLRCGYVSAGKTLYHTISNVNLTGMTDRATILMNSTTTPQVSIDGNSATGRTISLYFLNNTGKTISAIYAKPSSDAYFSQTNLIGTSLLQNGGQASTTFSYNAANPYYDFYATCTNGTNETYTRVPVTTTSTQTFGSVVLYANGKTGSTGGSSSGNGDTEVTFKNNSGSKIYEIRVGTKSSSVKSGTTVWSDSDGLGDGKTTTFSMDLGSTTKWYFGIYTTRNPAASRSPSASGVVNFKKTNAISARVTATEEDDGYVLMDYDDCDECDYRNFTSSEAEEYHKDILKDYKETYSSKDALDDSGMSSSYKDHYTEQDGEVSFSISQIKYDGSSSSSSSGDGDVDLNLVAYYDDIDHFYIVTESDYKDSKMDDDDYDDEYDDLISGTLDECEYELIEDALESDAYNYLVWVIGSSVYKSRIDVDEDAEWATVVITGKDKVECYDSEDERTLALVENYSDKNDVEVTLEPNSGSSITFDLDDGKFAYKWLSTSKTSDWNFDTDISGFEDSDVDLDDYNGFIHARFDEDDFTFNEIDD
ncbi:MAG: copper amine oxidase N-terminal domain-containing protein [Clostridiaceae bacterium]|nr:copper amine oxidase N-terminal domain-containing protein [Clostridiaceae bacterium]